MKDAPELFRGLEKGRRSPGTRLTTIALAERRDNVDSRHRGQKRKCHKPWSGQMLPSSPPLPKTGDKLSLPRPYRFRSRRQQVMELP
jgi:hypothetical protein